MKRQSTLESLGRFTLLVRNGRNGAGDDDDDDNDIVEEEEDGIEDDVDEY